MKLWKDSKARRSHLYVPADKPKFVNGAKDSKADCIILDLEDAVAPSKKDEARSMLKHTLETTNFGNKEVIVRINGIDTPYFEEDLKVIRELGNKVHAVLLPKVETAEYIKHAHEALPDMPLWLIMETARGVADVNDILKDAKHYHVEATVFGTQDFGKDVGVNPDSDMVWARSQVLTASRAHGCMVFDGVSRQLENTDLLQHQIKLANELGFDGKNIVHPSQIPLVHEAFTPTKEAVEKAKKLVAEMSDESVGVINAGGELAEQAIHLPNAKETLAIADAVDAMRRGRHY